MLHQKKNQQIYLSIRLMEILDKADKLLRTGSSEDIQNFLPEIVAEYCKLDDYVAQCETNFDKVRIFTYSKLKREKKDWKNSYSDKDIEILSKLKAFEEYERVDIDKKSVSHIKLYIDQLTQRKIDLAVQNKNLTAGVNI